jgi:Lrp/AsnC family leucine-responsive transcriptional regulator
MSHARTSWADLGALSGLSAPAAADRVRRLEEKGVIKGYFATIDPESIGVGMAALISVSLAHTASRSEFLALILHLPEVLECHHVAGEEDFILKVRCKGTRDLERLISEEIKSVSGISRTRTTVILSTVKETSILPLSAGEG